MLTPLAISLMATVALAIGMLGSLLAARTAAQAAADAAALAAAPLTFLSLPGAGSPVEAANRIAGANGAHLIRCTCPIDPSFSPRVIEVDVEARATMPIIGNVAIPATARAEFRPGDLIRSATGTLP
jgi:hypothetical protein